MYHVPADLNLDRFRGAILLQISLGEHQVQFNFQPYAHISVEGLWEIRDSKDSLIDRAEPHGNREAYRIHVLLGRAVQAIRVNAPQSFVLEFDGGYRLEVFDSSKEHESFEIQPGNIVV